MDSWSKLDILAPLALQDQDTRFFDDELTQGNYQMFSSTIESYFYFKSSTVIDISRFSSITTPTRASFSSNT